MKLKKSFISHVILLLSIVSLIISCTTNDNKTEKDELIKISVDAKSAVKINLSDIAESIRYIKLQTTSDNYFKSETNIIQYKSRIYLSDFENIFC